MTKQEEIREGIETEVAHLYTLKPTKDGLTNEAFVKTSAELILRFLHSQGVVIKVDEVRQATTPVAFRVAVEPLVKEAEDGVI